MIATESGSVAVVETWLKPAGANEDRLLVLFMLPLLSLNLVWLPASLILVTWGIAIGGTLGAYSLMRTTGRGLRLKEWRAECLSGRRYLRWKTALEVPLPTARDFDMWRDSGGRTVWVGVSERRLVRAAKVDSALVPTNGHSGSLEYVAKVLKARNPDVEDVFIFAAAGTCRVWYKDGRTVTYWPVRCGSFWRIITKDDINRAYLAVAEAVGK